MSYDATGKLVSSGSFRDQREAAAAGPGAPRSSAHVYLSLCQTTKLCKVAGLTRGQPGPTAATGTASSPPASSALGQSFGGLGITIRQPHVDMGKAQCASTVVLSLRRTEAPQRRGRREEMAQPG